MKGTAQTVGEDAKISNYKNLMKILSKELRNGLTTWDMHMLTVGTKHKSYTTASQNKKH
jgi:hypothetical protein